MTNATDEAGWRDTLARYRTPSVRAALTQLLDTVLPFAFLWWVMVRSLSLSYWVTLLLAIPAAFLFIRLFIIQHDCGHGGFFRSRRANDTLGPVPRAAPLLPHPPRRRAPAPPPPPSGR